MNRHHIINIEDRRVAPTLKAAVLFDSLEDLPTGCAVLWVACEPVGDEERFDCLWSGDNLNEIGEGKLIKRTSGCIVHRRKQLHYA